jgi:hypothetical protein
MGSKKQVEVNILELFKMEIYSITLSEYGSSLVNEFYRLFCCGGVRIECNVSIMCDFDLYFVFLVHFGTYSLTGT